MKSSFSILASLLLAALMLVACNSQPERIIILTPTPVSQEVIKPISTPYPTAPQTYFEGTSHNPCPDAGMLLISFGGYTVCATTNVPFETGTIEIEGVFFDRSYRSTYNGHIEALKAIPNYVCPAQWNSRHVPLHNTNNEQLAVAHICFSPEFTHGDGRFVVTFGNFEYRWPEADQPN